MSEPTTAAAVPDPVAAPAAAPSGRPEWLSTAVVIAAVTVAVVIAVAITPGFLTVDNVEAIMRNASIVGIAAVAMTPITLSGNFVSLGTQQSAMAAAVGFVALVGAGVAPALAIVIVLAGLVAIGALQGIVVAAGLNPVITTLATGAIVFGVASDATNGGIVRIGDPVSWGDASVLGVPIEVIVFALFTAAVTLLISRTVIGRETILVGANRATAELSGISFTKVTVVAFAIFSVGLAVAGILSGAAFGQATANSLNTLTIDVVAALLVGGTAIQGGRGSPLNSALGALLIAVITNVMVLNDFSTGGRFAVQGAVVVVVVIAFELVRRRGSVAR